MFILLQLILKVKGKLSFANGDMYDLCRAIVNEYHPITHKINPF